MKFSTLCTIIFLRWVFVPPRRPYGRIPMRPFILIRGGEHLGVADIYAKIPYDLSGSMSKNRFRQELCWSIFLSEDKKTRKKFLCKQTIIQAFDCATTLGIKLWLIINAINQRCTIGTIVLYFNSHDELKNAYLICHRLGERYLH